MYDNINRTKAYLDLRESQNHNVRIKDMTLIDRLEGIRNSQATLRPSQFVGVCLLSDVHATLQTHLVRQRWLLQRQRQRPRQR